MNQATLFSGIAERFGTEPQYLWAKFPEYAVFRHSGGKQKWFGAYLPVAAAKTGRKGDGNACRGRKKVVNGQGEHLAEIAHGAFTRIPLPVRVGDE